MNASNPLLLLISVVLIAETAQSAELPLDNAAHYREWPEIGSWKTTLMPLPNGRHACLSAMNAFKVDTGAKIWFSFWFEDMKSHLWVNYEGGEAPDPSAIILNSENNPFIWLTVISKNKFEGENNAIFVSDIPEDKFIKVILPHMLSRETITADVGGRKYPISTDGYRTSFKQLIECADIVKAFETRK